MNPIRSADIDWSNPAAPLASDFGDFYFSKKDGVAETDYVFIQHNQLPQRWQQHPRDHFCVMETGFGTGLNLMVLWRHFRTFRREHPDASCQRLHFVSFEKYPLSATDLSRAQRQWPEFAEMATQIRAAYPMIIQGCHRMVLDNGAVTVDLWFGDLLEQLPNLSAGQHGVADAWFLDGFSPNKNPLMWQDSLYAEMARLSRADATVATFTAASAVRKGLIAEGFAMQKDKGFRGKREMIFGQRSDHVEPTAALPKRVAVIGAGLAAANSALALTRRGIEVDLYFAADTVADGASGNRQGALYPLLNSANDPMAQFYQQGYLLARQQLNQLAEQHPIDHDWCGVLQLPLDDKQRQRFRTIAALDLDSSLVHAVDGQQAAHIADLPLGDGDHQDALFYPYGGWLSPQQLVNAVIAEAQQSGKLNCFAEHHLTELTAPSQANDTSSANNQQWQLQFADGTRRYADAVVLAAGHHSQGFSQTAPLPLNPVRGQIAYPDAQASSAKLKTVLCADGYLVPALNGQLTYGASFGRGDSNRDLRDDDITEMTARMAHSFTGASWLKELDLAAPLSADNARASVRAAVRDHLPLVGQVPHWSALQDDVDLTNPPMQYGLYLLSGLGSRGLCSAALCAELLASQLCGESLPVSQELAAKLAVGRFELRKIAKIQKAYKRG
ncbi:bifunctional tRNA (5-methylaminomethyl-2-thiouridine)(34)-methyltransferase MnmD/FAD-dependent 5-carboxymethylaminomethyl-2-thiouridine(34) oxidoreductase MnmC [Ferrimonas senticii]|uniref:bifunctional tRNA (5-methylaminomethyl-2-thiouridine)(34)-methyltransferase MnmD/FAD-dependent 5-carboxymethylaminomethyl-2-thiouridine(34) oxidoreductase MnmC n=1 Tax=Ferrimonas senticii TaxID=394566 RepID=UPI0004235FA6|nr:bifunctional tRNA (5-methylaminomethyl-2-thiouridine)(34)-methyltransferase MnmD/FAD-dependent 5-carboxymethylaminomethyl-2-thiouridine(34) oxidoreductase MnmC [Ferrimonas senticii]